MTGHEVFGRYLDLSPLHGVRGAATGPGRTKITMRRCTTEQK
jgi:hypothetical protein